MSLPESLQAVSERLLSTQTVGLEEGRELLEPICTALQALGVTHVAVPYSGDSDQGVIEDVDFEPGGVGVPEYLRDLIEAWVVAMLPAGWEINEGSQGWVTIDVAGARAQVEHEKFFSLPMTIDIG